MWTNERLKILILILDYMNKSKQIGKLKDKNSREKSLQGLNI